MLGSLDAQLLLRLAVLALQAKGNLLGGLGLKTHHKSPQKTTVHMTMGITHTILPKHHSLPSCGKRAWSDHRNPSA